MIDQVGFRFSSIFVGGLRWGWKPFEEDDLHPQKILIRFIFFFLPDGRVGRPWSVDPTRPSYGYHVWFMEIERDVEFKSTSSTLA